MTPKTLELAQNSRNKLKEGFRKVAEPVSATLGPKGRNIILGSDWGQPTPTKDGVTVAKEIVLKDPGENIGAQLIKQVSARTNDVAGDGPQPLYSKVLTPNGWVTMGDLKVGDEICGTNGSIQKVLEIYPKGEKEIYIVKFVDGREVECCADHTWCVSTHYGKSTLLTTKELLESEVTEFDGKYTRHKYYVPISQAEFNQSPDFPLDPYLVGLLLGDGSLSGTGDVELSLGPNDGFILDDIRLPEGISLDVKYHDQKHYYRVKLKGKTPDGKTMKDFLSEIGLLGTKSDTKFIPKQYLYSNVFYRTMLLQGLTDTDGHINKRGRLEYNTISTQLAKDVVELMRGLGKTVNTYLYERTGNSYSNTPIYRVTELKGCQNGIAISEIVIDSKKTEMQCIKVSNDDHLYFTDDYILTHNTTTATVLAYAMVDSGDKYLDKKVNATSLKNGIEKGVQKVFEYLSEQTESVAIEDIEKVKSIASISGNDSEVGKLVAEAFSKVGLDGTVTLHPNKMPFDELEVKEGFKFDRGYISPYFVTDQNTMRAELVEPYILVWEKRIEIATEMLPFLQSIAATNRPLVIISDDVTGDALSTLVVNKMKGTLNVVCVKAPDFGEMRKSVMQDIAVMTGATFIAEEMGAKLDRIKLDVLGTCDKIVVTANDTTIINGGGNKDQIKAHIEMLNGLLTDVDHTADVDKIKSRLARINGTAVFLKIGAKTDGELQEKKYRYEDAISATRAALESGIVVGGGKALLNCYIKMKDFSLENPNENIGLNILKEALLLPIKTIADNAGENGDLIVEKLIEKGATTNSKFGYNAKTGEYEDLFLAGVVDPVKVTKTALENAASIAGIFFTTSGLIYTTPKEDN